MILLGIAGNAPGCGKGKASEFLLTEAKVDGYSGVDFGFGDMIRGHLTYALSNALENLPTDLDCVSSMNWMTNRETKEESRIIQQVWPDVLRAYTGNELILINLWESWFEKTWSPNTFIINSSIRRQNEIDMIHRLGGQVLWIQRDSAKASSDHEVESALSQEACDYSINNNGSLEELAETMKVFWQNSLCAF